jgi:hypothetical protein
MFNAHQGLGEVLFAIYLIVLVVVYLMGRNGKEAPSWLVGLSHGLLALQVAMGVILISQEKYRSAVPWYHPVLGIVALLAIGLATPLRKRLGKTNGLVALLAILSVLTLATMLAVKL